MNLIQQHMENVSRELAQLEERMAQLKAEQEETRKLLANIRRYRKSLCKQYPSSQATLPLALPPDDEEEEATDEPSEDEADLAEARLAMAESDGQDATTNGGPAEATADGEPASEPITQAEANTVFKSIRRRKAKAVVEEAANG